MQDEKRQENRFLTDRMLGSLCRYLRLMGYDTISANSFSMGNNREDTELLGLSRGEERILLTRDHELAARAGLSGVLIVSEDVIDQVRQLQHQGFIDSYVRMTRCSLCNTILREACECEIRSAEYAPKDWRGFSFFWCEECCKLYWNGSHGRNLTQRVGTGACNSDPWNASGNRV